MAASSPQILAIHHLVHEYVNFVSSAELTIYGRDGNLSRCGIESPLNHHVRHAFFLNCRKLADFFQNKTAGKDDVIALHFVSGHQAQLPVSDALRERINKQLAHITYYRDIKAVEITKDEQKALYSELTDAWCAFRRALPPDYAAEMTRQIDLKKIPPEFLNLSIDC